MLGRTKPCPDHASSSDTVARPSSVEACHKGSVLVLNKASASVYLALSIKCCMWVGSLDHTHQTGASSMRPARTNKSPKTLKSRPCEDAAPMRLWRFRAIGTLRVLWRPNAMGDAGPTDGFRFIPSIGVVTLRLGTGESSGWLLCDGRRDRCSGSSSTSGRGKSETDGRNGNMVAFKYSLPSGLS